MKERSLVCKYMKQFRIKIREKINHQNYIKEIFGDVANPFITNLICNKYDMQVQRLSKFSNLQVILQI